MMRNPPQSIFSTNLQAAILIRHKLIVVARRITGSTVVAEDVVQDVLLQLLSCPLKPGIASQAAYIMQMVRNLATDHMRRARFERDIFVAEPVSGCMSQYGNPEEHLRECQALLQFQRAVESMPLRTRQFYMQHYLEGVPQNIIAEKAGVSRALVCGLLKDAHHHCISAMAANGDVAVKQPKERRH